jgi:hypothetical protein
VYVKNVISTAKAYVYYWWMSHTLMVTYQQCCIHHAPRQSLPQLLVYGQAAAAFHQHGSSTAQLQHYG